MHSNFSIPEYFRSKIQILIQLLVMELAILNSEKFVFTFQIFE